MSSLMAVWHIGVAVGLVVGFGFGFLLGGRHR